MRLVFLGPPGAGKGTIAKILSRKLGIAHVSTGDILRAKIQDGSDLGKKAKAYVDRGQLVPDEVVIEIVMEELRDEKAQKSFILDGFPRTEGQAQALEQAFEKAGGKLDGAFYFAISEKALIDRLGNRRTCERCGEIYHLKHIRPKQEGICDRCGGPLIQRKDDTEEAIRERIRAYETETAPLIDFYRRRNLLREVEAELTVSEVAERVEQLISPFAKGG